jgi:hypothetical protein
MSTKSYQKGDRNAMASKEFATIAELMQRYNITRKKALEIAYKVGTAPRLKGGRYYVSLAAADKYMGVE